MGAKIRNGYLLHAGMTGAYDWCLALQKVAREAAAAKVVQLTARRAAHLYDEAQITGQAVPRFLGDTAVAALHRQYRKAHREREGGHEADVETTVHLRPHPGGGSTLIRVGTLLDELDPLTIVSPHLIERYSYDEVNGPEADLEAHSWRRRGAAWEEAMKAGPALTFQSLGFDGFPFPDRKAVAAAIPSLEERAHKAGLDLLSKRNLDDHVGAYRPEDMQEFWRWLHTSAGERKLEEARAELLTTLVNPFPTELLYPPEAG